MPKRQPPLEAAKQPVHTIALHDAAPGTVCIPVVDAATAGVSARATEPRRSSIPAYREIGDASPATPVANGNYTVGWIDCQRGKSATSPDEVRFLITLD